MGSTGSQVQGVMRAGLAWVCSCRLASLLLPAFLALCFLVLLLAVQPLAACFCKYAAIWGCPLKAGDKEAVRAIVVWICMQPQLVLRG